MILNGLPKKPWVIIIKMSDMHESDSPAAGSETETPMVQEPMWDIEEDEFFDIDPVQREKILAARTAKLRQAILNLAAGATPEQLRDLLN